MHFTRSSDASVSTVEDQVVLFHRVSRTTLVLNPTGAWMWEQLATPQTSESLVRGLRERFPSLAAEAAERDIHAFLADLTTHAMVSIGP